MTTNGIPARPRGAAIVGPYVAVTLEVAAAWAPKMAEVLREASKDGGYVAPQVRDVVEAFRDAAAFVSESKRSRAADGSAFSEHAYSASEVAEFVGLTEQAVTLAARRGQLYGSRVGRTWRFERRDVDEWISERSASKPPVTHS